MRVISQDGAVDVPYETGSFNMICAELVEPKRTNIYCHHSSIGVAIKIAEYSAEAKALKAMEMLREAFFENKHEETYRDGIYYYSPCFQFLQNNEIEV